MARKIELILKWLMPIVVLSILFTQIKSELGDVSNVYQKITFSLKSLVLTLLLFVGMFLNWFLEAYKWKVLITKISTISMGRAIQSILNGLAFGLFTPFRVGDVITRIGHLDHENRNYALGCVYVARSSQLVSTLIFGLSAAYLYFEIDFTFSFLLYHVVLLILFTLYFRAHLVLPYLKKINIFSKYLHYIESMGHYSYSELLRVLLISSVRYGVIILQYILMFYLFNIDLSYQYIIIGVSVTLFVKSTLPIVSVLGDFGIRELVAIYIFSKYGVPSIAILSVTVGIWLLNIVLPSTIGSFLSKNLKIAK